MFKISTVLENEPSYGFTVILPILLNILNRDNKRIDLRYYNSNDVTECKTKLLEYKESIIEFAVLAEYLKHEFCEMQHNQYVVGNYTLLLDIVYLLFTIPCKPIEDVLQKELEIFPNYEYDLKTSARAYCTKTSTLQYRNLLDLFFRVYSNKDYNELIKIMKLGM